MNVDALDRWLVDLLAELPGVEIVFKPEWDALTFQVAGKHFGRVSGSPTADRLLTIKGEPENNVALMAQYASVSPGYYANKRLWVSLDLGASDVPLEVKQEVVRLAYALVREALPKRVQAELGDFQL